MNVLIVDNAKHEDSAFNRPLIECVSRFADGKVVNYSDLPSVPQIREHYDAIILSGAPLHYEFEVIETIAAHHQELVGVGLPLLGICLGHQVIGRVFGSTVIHDTEAELGLVETHVAYDDPLFEGITPTFMSLMRHRASITLPEQFVLLANTAGCANVIMKHRDKIMYGIQAHPELSPDGPLLLRNFLRIAQSSL